MSRPIVFYDGVCGLCDGFVRFVLARDRLARYRFAPLQGETAWLRLGDHLTQPELKTVVLQEDSGTRVRSDAVIAIIARLGHGWGLINLLRIVPRFLRDFVYEVVSRFRYRWFGKRAACRIPAPDEIDRFLP
ncbi:MAG TPA: DCC1-like thiol-disulfide oxidoreductase family protein [Gemmatimonadales bacterium]|nr:DCC1-like thiol-disulfide oxidoreductase family protein [Gemmatimonadales bacterium]